MKLYIGCKEQSGPGLFHAGILTRRAGGYFYRINDVRSVCAMIWIGRNRYARNVHRSMYVRNKQLPRCPHTNGGAQTALFARAVPTLIVSRSHNTICNKHLNERKIPPTPPPPRAITLAIFTYYWQTRAVRVASTKRGALPILNRIGYTDIWCYVHGLFWRFIASPSLLWLLVYHQVVTYQFTHCQVMLLKRTVAKRGLCDVVMCDVATDAWCSL